MYKSRIQYAIDNFIVEHYFLPMSNSYQLRETKDSGKSLLNVTITGDNICIADFDNKKKCGFLRTDKKFGMQKSVDHILLKCNEENWDLYMIEMKSNVGDHKWLDIKAKMRASLLNVKALCEILGITIQHVYTYTTFEKESFSTPEKNTDPKTLVPMLGQKAKNFKQDEWDKGVIKLCIDDIVEFPHQSIKMIRDEEHGLQGTLQI